MTATTTQEYGLTDRLIAYEEGELDEAETIELYQQLVDSGMAWQLQGSYGRTAMAMIEAGLITLGPQRQRDYWGNTIPSRDDVVPGTMGSPEYVAARRGEVAR